MGSATEWVGRGSNGRSLAQSVRNWSTDILELTGCLSSAKDFFCLLFFVNQKGGGAHSVGESRDREREKTDEHRKVEFSKKGK